MKRIGINALRLFNNKRHGLGWFSFWLLHSIQAQRSEFKFFIFVDKIPEHPDIFQSANFQFVELGTYAYPYLEQILLPKKLKELNIDLLHNLSTTGPINWKGETLTTLHDIMFTETFLKGGNAYQIFGNMYRRYTLNKICKNSHLITISNSESKKIKQILGCDSDVIHHGVSPAYFNKPSNSEILNLKKKYNLPKEFCMMLGNNDPRKNIERVVVNWKSKTLPLVIVNSPSWLIESDFIRTIPYVDFDELVLFYWASDSFIFPSSREGFGLPLLESMATKTPVICSDIEVFNEIDPDVPFFFDLNTEFEQISSIVEKSMNLFDPHRAAFGQKIAQKYTWNEAAKKYIFKYKEILDI